MVPEKQHQSREVSMRQLNRNLRRMNLYCVLSVLAGLVLTAAISGPSLAQVTAYEGARLITGDGGTPIEDSVFIVEGTRIAQVGRRGQVTVPAGAARVDLAGKTVMP